MSKEFVIKFHKKDLKLSSGDDRYEVRTEGGKDQKVKFKDDAKKGNKAEAAVKLEYRKKDEGDDK